MMVWFQKFTDGQADPTVVGSTSGHPTEIPRIPDPAAAVRDAGEPSEWRSACHQPVPGKYGAVGA
jgi:hypothetical protein